jgi:NAD(P)-dependent dehydrogenase (short-subunit alcohol dehydrogenase family)
LVEKIKVSEGGKLDILVANAGATWGSRFEDAPDEASVKILDLNVRGVFNLVKL